MTLNPEQHARRLIVWVLVAALSFGVLFTGTYFLKPRAASLPTVRSCKGLTVKKVGRDWLTVNSKGRRVRYTGVASNRLGWWRVVNGKVNFKATGLYSNDYGWWRVENGQVNFKANSVYQNQYGWWKTNNGHVTFHENGVFQNSLGWWKVTNSKVDFSYTGVASNQFGSWYVEHGKVNFDAKANGRHKFNGQDYMVKGGVATPSYLAAIKAAREVADSAPKSQLCPKLVVALLTDPTNHEFKFNDKEAEYAADHANINWGEAAYSFIADHLTDDNGAPEGVSKQDCEEILKAAAFKDPAISYAMKKVDEDKNTKDYDFWMDNAKVAAQKIRKEKPDVSQDDLKKALRDLDFTEDQVNYGATEALKGAKS